MFSKKVVVSVLGVVSLVGTAVLFAQSQQTPNILKLDKKENMPKAKVADLAWLAGHWEGDGLSGKVEEFWSPPVGDNLIGMFRLMKDGKTHFTEFFSIVAEGESLVLKLKHFGPDLVGWEEKDKFVEFRLVKLSPTEANFDGLTYRKNGDQGLDVFVVFKSKDGKVREESFKYKRVAPSKP